MEDNGKFKADHIVRLDIKSKVAIEQNDDQYEDPEIPTSPHYEKAKSSTTSKIIKLSGFFIILTLAGLVYNQYQSYQIQKQQKLEELILEQQRMSLSSEQRKAILPIQGLSEQGRKNLENHGTDLRSQVNSVNLKTLEMISSSFSQFKCDVREHCSQMSSYEEALFFIRNCPNTKMDGDGDGIPCESQF